MHTSMSTAINSDGASVSFTEERSKGQRHKGTFLTPHDLLVMKVMLKLTSLALGQKLAPGTFPSPMYRPGVRTEI